MKPEDQRIAIALACGYRAWERERAGYPPLRMEYEWSRSHPDNQRINGWELTEHKDLCDPASLPRYQHDLNACAEMEKHIVEAGGCYTHYVDYLQRLTEHNEWRATAPQRCEAFLRACGLWQE